MSKKFLKGHYCSLCGYESDLFHRPYCSRCANEFCTQHNSSYKSKFHCGQLGTFPATLPEVGESSILPRTDRPQAPKGGFAEAGSSPLRGPVRARVRGSPTEVAAKCREIICLVCEARAAGKF